MRTSRAVEWALALGEGERRRLFLWTPVLLGLGIQLYFLSPVEPPVWAPAASAALAAALAAAGLRDEAWRLPCLAAAWLAAGFGLASLRTTLVAAPILAGDMTAVIEGRVRAVEQSRAGRPRLLLDEVRVFGLAPDVTPARARLTLRAGDGEGVRPGELVSALAALGPPAGPAEPGAFDFRRMAYFDRIGAVAVARGRLARLGSAPASGLEAAAIGLDATRAAIGAWLRAGVGGEAGAFAAAITIGDAAALPTPALEALRDSNLAHLLSISGLHMVVVAGLAFGTVRFGLALAPGAALWLPAKKLAAGAALAAAVAYLALSGAATPTQRAFVMAAAAFAAIIAGRPAVTMRALALAALVVLAVAPESLLGVGFQMSFAATLALVAAYETARRAGWLAPGAGRWRRAARVVGGLVATSLVAGAATAPFAAFHFNRVTTWGLPANLLAVPAMSVATAPALAAAAAAAPFGLDGPLLKVAGWSIDWMLAVARFFAGLPGATRPAGAVAAAAIWATVAGGLWLCLWRGRLKAAAAPALAAATALWLWGAERPAAIVAPEGVVVGVMTPAGRVVDARPGESFAAETWLRRDGDAATAREAMERPGFMRAGPWREATLPGGWRLVATRAAGAAGAAQRCRDRTLIVAPSSPAPPGPCILLDGAYLARNGSVAVYLRANEAILRPARAITGDRPWTRGSDGAQ